MSLPITARHIGTNDKMTHDTTFYLMPFGLGICDAEGKWKAVIQQRQSWPDGSVQTIAAECLDYDPLRAMEKAQTQLFSTGLLPVLNNDDPTDICWNQLIQQLEAQYGFPLA